MFSPCVYFVIMRSYCSCYMLLMSLLVCRLFQFVFNTCSCKYCISLKRQRPGCLTGCKDICMLYVYKLTQCPMVTVNQAMGNHLHLKKSPHHYCASLPMVLFYHSGSVQYGIYNLIYYAHVHALLRSRMPRELC